MEKNQIREYIIDRLHREGDKSLVSNIIQACGTTQATTYRYLKELESEGIIERKNKSVILKETEEKWSFSNNDRFFQQDNLFYDEIIYPHLKKLPQNVIQIWDYCFTEMMNNVIDHSGTKKVDIILQINSATTKIYLRDYGIGIFRNVMEVFDLPSVNDSYAELIKGKLTTDADNHSGEGLFFTSRVLDYFAAIANGIQYTYNKYEEINILLDENKYFSDFDQTGTLIYMELSNNSKKTMKELFDRYTDEDFVFNKTIIPVKNIFPYPVSRSQANRMMNRCDQFSEVTLDFCGIDAIGQGFADQIFRIYIRKNPEVKILAKNMSPTVERMVRHVQKTGHLPEGR